MEKFVFALLALTLLLLGCKKENTTISDDPKVMELTFTGTVTDDLTRLPTANVPVHIVYGTMCCGGIMAIIGRDSANTDSRGSYTIRLKYTKGDAAYRHIVYVPGYSAKPVKLPTALQRNWVWMTTDYDAAAVLPNDLADTVKIVKGLVTTANFKILPASIVQIKFPYAAVPATDSLVISATSSLNGISSVYANNLNQSRSFRPNYEINSFPAALEFPGLTNREIIIKTAVYETASGMLKTTVMDSVTLVQGQLYYYNVHY